MSALQAAAFELIDTGAMTREYAGYDDGSVLSGAAKLADFADGWVSFVRDTDLERECWEARLAQRRADYYARLDAERAR